MIGPVRWLPLSLLVHASLLGGGVWLVHGVGERPLLVDLTLMESPERASSPPGARPAVPARRRQASAPAARAAAAPASSTPVAAPEPVAPSPAPAAVPPVGDTPPAASPAPVVTAPAAPSGPADSVVATEAPIAPAPSGGGAAGGEGARGGGAAAVSATRGGADGGGTVALAIPGDGGAGAYGPYLTALRRRLQEALEYPTAARRRGLTGTVHLEIALEATGHVSDVLLVRSSSHAVLDAAALDAARNLHRVPFPPDVRPRALRVRLPVVFELR